MNTTTRTDSDEASGIGRGASSRAVAEFEGCTWDKETYSYEHVLLCPANIWQQRKFALVHTLLVLYVKLVYTV